MADTNNKLIILSLLICLLPHIVFSSASAKDNDTKAYVDSWCQTTLYQERCVRSLSPYVSLRATQSPEDLVLFVLKQSLYLATNTTAFLLKDVMTNLEPLAPQLPRLVNNCISLLRHMALDNLFKIISGMKSNNVKSSIGAKYINLQRSKSTALADLETLVSKFQGRRLSKLEATIYEKVKNVEETTSNAFAIVQHYAATRP